MKNWLLHDILKKEKMDKEENLSQVTNFLKLSQFKKKLILILLYNFMNQNGLKRYESAYTALYDALKYENTETDKLVESIERKITDFNNIDLNLLFNVITNNKYKISDIEQLKNYDAYLRKDYEAYRLEKYRYGKRNMILSHFFNMSCTEANDLLKKYKENPDIVSKYKNFFEDLALITSYDIELPNELFEVEKMLKTNKTFMKKCNYHMLDLTFKQEFGRELKNELFTISDAVTLNETQKEKMKKELQKRGIKKIDVIDEMYQIPFYSNGDVQPFTILLKGIRYVNGEFGDHRKIWKEKRYNSLSCINDKMIGLFAISQFYLGYDIEESELCLASTEDGGSFNYGTEYTFDPRMADERYLSIDDFIFKTTEKKFHNYSGKDKVSYAYNEIVIDKSIPSYIVCFKSGDEIKNLDAVLTAKKDYEENGLKLPILIIDLENCLKTQINNIVDKCNNYILNNENVDSFETIIEQNEEIRRLYIQSLATITFMKLNDNFYLKDEIKSRINIKTKIYS